jgi:molybdopterin synthase sulfur carrier subunit
MITIRYFAQLKENLDCAEERLQLSADISDVGSLRTHLAAREGAWQQSFKQRLMAAVNQEMAQADTPIKAGDEVAFFPPVTGG